MANMSTYLRNQLRDHLFRDASFTKPSELWISAHTGDPGLTGLNEVSGGSYARVQRDPANANWSGDVEGETDNLAVITFPAPTADWGIVTYFGVWDAASGGNFILKGQLAIPKTINSGDQAPSFAIEALVFNFE